MIAAVPAQRTPAPSVQKYGQAILQHGFTQIPRSLESYINALGISQSAKLLILALLSYIREYGQEVFPAVRTLAGRIGRSIRQVFYLLSELKAQGLIAIYERQREDGGRDTNGYSLVPLFERVAAASDPQIAEQLARRDAENTAPFQPQDQIDEAAIALEEEYGQPTPRAERETARRIRSRWEKVSAAGHEWGQFAALVIEAGDRAEQRGKIPTRSRRPFTGIIPYFFSSLDRLIAQADRPAPARVEAAARCAPATTRPQPAKMDTSKPAQSGQSRKPRASAELAREIDKIARDFHDTQIKSSVQQAANLQAEHNLDESTMLTLVQQAREAAQQHQVKRRNAHGQFNRMPYFFSVLRSLVTLAHPQQQ